jgi:hypothetical protein
VVDHDYLSNSIGVNDTGKLIILQRQDQESSGSSELYEASFSDVLDLL